jgi:hypothetical protein
MRRKRTVKKFALAALAVTALAACGTTTDPNITQHGKEAASTTKAKGLHTVVYTVQGTARKGSINYSTPSGQEQINGSKLPWSKTFKAENGTVLSVMGQIDAGAASITCTITLDGKTIKRAKSSGEYSVVSCDAFIGF